jgi:hypothetical protein
MKLLRYLFIFIFIGLLCFPLINNKGHFILKTFEGIIPSPPPLNIKRLDPFPKSYEDYFEKSLEIKPWMVGINSKLKMNVFNLSPNPERVMVGRDKWLFLAGDNTEVYRGTNLFTAAELQTIKDRIHARALRARSASRKFYFVIVPIKQSIYPEYLPLSVKKVKDKTWMDQVYNLFADDSLVEMIDVRDALIVEKPNHLLYYKTDNHWNDIGGYVAYKKIASVLQADFPAIRPVGLDLFVMDSARVESGGEAVLMNADDWLRETKYDYNPGRLCKAKEGIKKGYKAPEGFPYPWDYEMVRETGDTTLPDAIIIRDSFGDAMLPYLSENFNRSVFIFDAWQYKANYEIIDAENPDLVLYMVVESDLDSFLKFE